MSKSPSVASTAPSRYDDLDPATELEQQFVTDLRAALEPRGCVIVHRGKPNRNAPGGGSDILVKDSANRRLILVEVTKRKGSDADGEFPAIVDHLNQAVRTGGFDEYGVLYISPATSARMRAAIADMANRNNAREGRPGRIIAIDFAGAQTLLDRLIKAEPALYPSAGFGEALRRWEEARDDVRALRLLTEALMGPDDVTIRGLDREARELDTAAEQGLRQRIQKLEDHLRGEGITGQQANTTLIYLTFMRLYEEKRQRDTGQPNRMTKDGFTDWAKRLPAETQRLHQGRLSEFLLHELAEDEALRDVGLLRRVRDGQKDDLHEAMNDQVLEKWVLPVFDAYDFSGALLDVLGVVFETLAQRAGKDTKIGQFFTPQEVVDFCGKLVGLTARDVVLDPAVGTGRFLVKAMHEMLAIAATEGGDRLEAERHIRESQLLGTDLDAWVATIAKMNMFIHGDGKSNVENSNGLVLADRPILSSYRAGIAGKVDVVLTNPPLGDISYVQAAEAWKKSAVGSVSDEDVAGYYQSLGVVPMAPAPLSTEQRRRRREAAEAERVKALADEPASPSRDLLIRSAATRMADRTRQVLAVERPTPPRPTGEQLKGGALFLGAIANYLKTDRDPSAHYEWRGGRAIVVVDEAVLNTPEYADVRVFIRERFFIKAVVSLGRTAFKYLAHTDAKTSIIYLIRKPNPNIVQREPIFFAHAERCGYSATGKWLGTDLPAVLEAFSMFSNAIQSSYRRAQFDYVRFTDAIAGACRSIPWHARAAVEGDARFDFYDAHYHALCEDLASSSVPMTTVGALIEPRQVAHPNPDRSSRYNFAGIERETATVNAKGNIRIAYLPKDLWLIQEGDIVVSGIDLVNGAIAVAGPEVSGMVMSKEMYAYRVKKGVPALPGYIALSLRSAVARDLILGLVSGTSNRTRLADEQQLLELPIPQLPPLDVQRQAVTQFEQSIRARRTSVELLRAAESEAAMSWPALAVARSKADDRDEDQAA